MSLLLLSTKLHIPPAQSGIVPRPRLLERLDAGLPTRLTLVSAPAGSGKTTLLCDWLRSLENRQKESGGLPHRIAWISLDADDNDPARFYAYLKAALTQVVAEEELVDNRELPTIGAQDKPILTNIINTLAASPAHVVLVLDDYHVLTQRSIHEGIGYLLEHRPPQLHMVIASRTDPPLQLATLRARGQLSEIRNRDLRFAHDETAALLNETMRLGLNSPQLAALEKRTEGWIAGLYLSAISLQGAEDKERFIRQFAGSQRHIVDYLMAEVMQQQPTEVQDFLLNTSILERLSAAVCDAVRGEGRNKQSSQTLLEHLERANLFVVPLDERRRWYRYHHLFASFLQARLHASNPHQVPELHKRASQWYLQEADHTGDDRLLGKAIEHAIQAQDYAQAVQLIEQAADATLRRSEVVAFLNWIEAIPSNHTRQRPLLQVYYAGLKILEGQPVKVVEANLRELGEPETSGSLPAAIAVFQSLIATYRGDRERSRELARRALATLPKDNLFLSSFVPGFQGLQHLYSGDLQAAHLAFSEAVHIGQQAGNLMIVVLATCHLADVAYVKADLNAADLYHQQALDLARDESGRLRPIGGIPLLGRGMLLLERDQLDAAANALETGLGLAAQWGEVATTNGYLGLARIQQLRGDPGAANELVERAHRLAVRFDAMDMDDIAVDKTRVQLRLAQGNLAAALEWAAQRESLARRFDTSGTGSGHPPGLMHAMEYVTLVRVHLAAQRYQQVVDMVRPFLAYVQSMGWTAFAIDAHILQALAQMELGLTRDALSALHTAVALARPGGFIRLFLNYGQPMEKLLQQMQPEAEVADYVHFLLERFSQPHGKMTSTASVSTSTLSAQLVLPEPLSDREIEVLGLIISGHTNQQIADRLFVALSTIKTHINHIYGKLEVTNRAQAIQRAHDLGLF